MALLTVFFLERIITEQKRTENHIQHLQRVLKAIRDVNQLIARQKDQKELLQETCEILARTRNYKLVWIGLVQKGTKEILVAAKAGLEEGYLQNIKITWDDSATGEGPTGTAVKTKKPCTMRNITRDPRYLPWRKRHSGGAMPHRLPFPWFMKTGYLVRSMCIHLFRMPLTKKRWLC
nr:GAF domain-containing protein [Desulfolithobacter dissulfuricans]